MLTNKYNFGRRLLYRVYDAFPPARFLKKASMPLKIRKLRRLLDVRRRELDEAMATHGRHPLFSHVEVEMFNRCNGECAFCPVNRHIDPRTPMKMSEDLFASILG